jgi:hypothetical protein
MPGQSSPPNSWVPKQNMHEDRNQSNPILFLLKSRGLGLILFITLIATHHPAVGQDNQTDRPAPKISKADTTREIDNSNGKGGTKLTIKQTFTHGENDVDEYEENVFIDPNGVVRERRSIMRYTGAAQKSEENIITYGLKTGKPVSQKIIAKDEGGTMIFFKEERFKDELNPDGSNNVQISGYNWYFDDNGKKITKKYNPKTKAYEDAGNTAMPENDQVGNAQSLGNTPVSYHDNQVFLGPAYMNIANSGKGSMGYGSFGFTGEYSRYFTPHIGATFDVGAYFHKETQDGYTQSYTQLNFTIGPTFIPFKNPQTEDKKLSGNLFALFGLSSIMVKESSGSYGIDQESKQGFTACIGGALDYKINDKFALRAQVAYTPTFFFNTMQNNARISAGLVYGFGSGKTQTGPTDQTNLTTQAADNGGIIDSTEEKWKCNASGITTEVKISLYAIEKAAKLIEAILKKIPKVKDPKVVVSPILTVKRGEACCSDDKLPVTYTELKGGVEGTVDLELNLWGMPDIDYEVDLWTVLLKIDVECKIYGKINGKINFTAVGKFFGALGQTDRPDCKACYYLDFKTEIFGGLGAKMKGAVDAYFWSPLSRSEGGYDRRGKPDEEVEVSADASTTIGCTNDGTYASSDCEKPTPGLHGQLVLGKAKFNFKIKVELGPLSFHPSLEIPLLDGIKIDY